MIKSRNLDVFEKKLRITLNKFWVIDGNDPLIRLKISQCTGFSKIRENHRYSKKLTN